MFRISGMMENTLKSKENNLTNIIPLRYNSPIELGIGGLIMSGTIRCNKDGNIISEKTGTCPKCGKIQCHIAVFWHERLFRYYKDINGIVFSYMSALDQLQAMNREMRTKTFKAELWQSGALKDRKIEQSVNRWLTQKKVEVDRNELSYGTYHAYRSRVNNHILNSEYGLGAWDIREITFAEIEQFKDNLPHTLKIKGRREIMRTFYTFCRWAWRKGLIPSVPAFPVVKGNDSTERLALSIEDQHKALATIPSEHRDFYELETEVGTRPGETCALKVKDVDFVEKTVIVRRTFTMGKLRESDKEGHKKSVPLSPRAFEIVQKHAKGKFPDDWLLTHPKTKNHYTVLRTGIIWKQFTKLPISHYEGTRHSFATQIAELDDIKAAQELLRHSDMRSTQKYIHRRTEYLRDALQKRTNVVELHRKEKAQQE